MKIKQCPSCHTATVKHNVVTMCEKIKYEGVLYYVFLPYCVVPQCRRCGEVFFTNEVEEKINNAFRSKIGILSPTQIIKARDVLHFSVEELASRSGLHIEYLRQVENGAELQTKREDGLLRHVLNISQGAKNGS